MRALSTQEIWPIQTVAVAIGALIESGTFELPGHWWIAPLLCDMQALSCGVLGDQVPHHVMRSNPVGALYLDVSIDCPGGCAHFERFLRNPSLSRHGGALELLVHQA